MSNKPSQKEVTLTQVIHYAKDDPNFIRDYSDIELKHGEEVIAIYGDGYHDKGLEKIAGFVQGVEWALEATVKLITQQVADREW